MSNQLFISYPSYLVNFRVGAVRRMTLVVSLVSLIGKASLKISKYPSALSPRP